MTFEFHCKEKHVTLQKVSLAESKVMPEDSTGTKFVDCDEPGCDLISYQQFMTSLNVFNSPGFYGNWGTQVASGVTGM